MKSTKANLLGKFTAHNSHLNQILQGITERPDLGSENRPPVGMKAIWTAQVSYSSQGWYLHVLHEAAEDSELP